MFALVNGIWRGDYLDYHLGRASCRIRVLAMANIASVEDQYFVPRLSLRRVLSYVREFGIVPVLRKIRSRLQERARNAKYISCGVGVVLEDQNGGGDSIDGTLVGFVAPSHPECADQLVLDHRLVFPLNRSDFGTLPLDRVLHLAVGTSPVGACWLRFAGFTFQAGWDIPPKEWQCLADETRRVLASIDWRQSKAMPEPVQRELKESRPARTLSARSREKRTGVLFGFGQYAKTTILPAVRPFCNVKCIHEVDPLQIPNDDRYAWDTSPYFRPEETYDVVFISGYHHTHAPLAVAAMKHGASAVVIEKPIATTREDLSDLTQMWKSAPHVRVFCGYQKRYSALSDHIARHFRGVEAISYHCTVYETQLPAKHWYRWPVSGSRILSNGCHWIDHFLHLNDFAPVDRFHVRADADDVITCVIVLQNGAVFTMVMSDQGSARLGMRDYVELRAGDKTARIIDDHKCELDSTSRLQKVAVRSRLMSYHRMYARIGSLIATGSNGDSIHSLTSSAALILSIHEALCSQRSDHVSAVS